MSGAAIDPIFCDLVAAAVNGEATAEQMCSLESRLLENEAARDFYLDYLNVHSALRRRFISPEADSLSDSQELAEFRSAMSAELFVGVPRKRSSLRWAVSLAAIFLLTVGGWYWRESFSSSAVTGTVRSVSGECLLVGRGGSRVLRAGDMLRPGETLRAADEEARAVIGYPDGTVVRVHGDSAVESPAKQVVRLRLLAGSMEVDAAKQPAGRPLLFETEHSRYVVLGTRFRLYHEASASRLELDEGKVRLERSAGDSIEVEAGQVAIAPADASPIEVQPLSPGSAELAHTIHRGGQNVLFAAEGTRLYASNFETGLKEWALDDASLVSEYRDDSGHSEGLALTADGRLVQVNQKGFLIAWRPGEAEGIKVSLPGLHPRSRCLSPDGTTVAVSAADGTRVYGIDFVARELEQRLHVKREVGKAWCLALSANGSHLAAGYWDGSLRVYDLATGAVTFEHKLAHTPTRLDITADGKRLAVFTQKDGLQRFDVATAAQVTLWPAGAGVARSLRFSRDGRRILAGMNDRTARMWAADDGRQLLVIDAGHSPVGIAWCDSEQVFATADGTVKLWQCRFDAQGSKE